MSTTEAGVASITVDGARAAASVPSTGFDANALDSVHMEVLAHLCSGAKDETAARLMRISVRTYRRRVASLLASMNARSRFQAGLKAAQLGPAIRAHGAATGERRRG